MVAPAKKKGGNFVVSAPLVQAVVGDRVVHLFKDDVVPDNVSQESLDHLLGLGYVDTDDVPARNSK